MFVTAGTPLVPLSRRLGADSDQGVCVAHTELAGGICRVSYLETHVIKTIV